jgi:hypothetical protein
MRHKVPNFETLWCAWAHPAHPTCMSVIFSMLHMKISTILNPEWRVGKHIYVNILQTYYTIDTVKRQLQKS